MYVNQEQMPVYNFYEMQLKKILNYLKSKAFAVTLQAKDSMSATV